MPLTLRDITWASLSETRNHRDKIAVSVSERRTYVLANADGSLKLASHIFRSPVAVTLVENGGDALLYFTPCIAGLRCQNRSVALPLRQLESRVNETTANVHRTCLACSCE